MALIIACNECGFILRYEESKIVSPYEVARQFGSRCPKCKSMFSIEKFEIEIQERNRRRTSNQMVIRYRSSLKTRRVRRALKRSRRIF